MAASARAITPTHTGPFSSGSVAPGTPASIPSASQSIGASADKPAFVPRPPASLAPNPVSALHHALRGSLSPQSAGPGLSPRQSPPSSTGAAAMADERRLRPERERDHPRPASPNPGTAAIQALLGGAPAAMSKPRDAPPVTATMSEPLAKVAKSIIIPDQPVATDNMQTSPVSLSSFGSADSTTAAPTATVTVTEPATAGPPGLGLAAPGPASEKPAPVPTMTTNGGETNANRAFTFPGPIPLEQTPHAPPRGMSLPMAGYGHNSPKSPSTKRHKCPYCSTDFTRHHNLKSHLLTHSQEKPYECPTCQARFRRLHDLKRHTKLHTGERPHTCDKCGRRFARGDALARHNKGQGGCAGRRSSLGIDEEMAEHKAVADDHMDGLEYQHRPDHADDDRMDEDVPRPDDRRRVSEPSHKGRQPSAQSAFHQHSSTYPPASQRGVGNSVRPIYPPPPQREAPGNLMPKSGDSNMAAMHFNPSQSVFPPGGMTESPKPISPAQLDQQARLAVSEAASLPGGRSPNMSQQMHQQHFGRGAGRGSFPPVGNNVQLPSLPGLAPTDPRMAMAGKAPGPQQGSKGAGQPPHNSNPAMMHQQPPGPAAASSAGSMSSHSHGPSSGGSMRDFLGGRDVDAWEYVRSLEARFQRSQEETEARLSRMQEEIFSLKGQLQQQHQHQGQMQQVSPNPAVPQQQKQQQKQQHHHQQHPQQQKQQQQQQPHQQQQQHQQHPQQQQQQHQQHPQQQQQHQQHPQQKPPQQQPPPPPPPPQQPAPQAQQQPPPQQPSR